MDHVSTELCGGLHKPLKKFVCQVLFGIRASQDVKRSNVVARWAKPLPDSYREALAA